MTYLKRAVRLAEVCEQAAAAGIECVRDQVRLARRVTCIGHASWKKKGKAMLWLFKVDHSHYVWSVTRRFEVY
jgi:hypothetical protein